jgi:hypothetical protein
MSNLAIKNVHPRDNHITFDEPTHVYTVNGSSKGVISVTKLLSSLHSKFDADKIIQGMKKSPKWPESPYFGMSDAEIKKQWNDNGAQASSAGTALHLAIEEYLDGQEITNRSVLDSVEWTHFMEFWNQHKTILEPYRMEWSVYIEELKLAGQIDAVFRRKSDGAFFIYDWKRVKEIKYENTYQNCLDPIGHLPDTNYWHYTLQLNVYRYILENYYGMPIKDMYLIVLYPDNKTFRKLRLNRMDAEVQDILRTLETKKG